MSNSLDDAERLARLRLFRSQNVGPVTYRHLLARYGTAAEALAALPELAKRGGRRKPITIFSRADAEAELEALTDAGGALVIEGDAHYPEALSVLNDSPPVLQTLGHAHLLDRPMFAIVGARNASAVGLRIARDIAAALGEKKIIIVSGMARGIDSAAHRGALETGTVAVLAGGVDIVYPPENEDLYAQIGESGLALSEMPPGTTPQARHFPRRNRIISGLSHGVLVVEAAPRSGSLITARLANEQGREVFAVPGSPLDPRAQGTNGLIRDGATLVQSAGDILAVLEEILRRPLAEPEREPLFDFSAAPAEDELEQARGRLAGMLGYTPVGIDDLIRECGLPPAVVMTVLLELELAGRLTRQTGNQVSLSADTAVDEIA